MADTFDSMEQRQSALAEFKDRCSRRFDNFWPPIKQHGDPFPSVAYLKWQAQKASETEVEAKPEVEEKAEVELKAEAEDHETEVES